MSVSILFSGTGIENNIFKISMTYSITKLITEHLLLPKNSLGSKGQHWTKDINTAFYDTVDNSKQ